MLFWSCLIVILMGLQRWQRTNTNKMNKHLPTFSGKTCASLRTSTVGSEKRNLNLTFLVVFSALFLGGSTNGLKSQTIGVQFIHAAQGEMLDTVDVYVNEVRVVNDLPRNAASAFLTGIPTQTGIPLQITLSPAESSSAVEGFFTQTLSFQENGLITIALIGEYLSAASPLQCLVDPVAQTLSSDTSRTAVSFLHAASGAAAFDAVLREGDMVFGALGYGQFTPYLNLKPDDLFLDVKASGTSNILSTYRLSTGPYRGQAFRVFVSGDMSSAASLRMFAVYSDGFVTPVDFAPVARVQYFNALTDTVDVYKNGTKFSNDAAPGAAMPYKYIPAGILMNISVSPYTSTNALNAYAKFASTFENTKTYAAVSAGIRDDALHPLQMFFYDKAREISVDTNSVGLLFFQGNPDWPMADVRLSQFNDLFSAVSYGDFKGYQHLDAAGQLKLRVYDFGSMTMLAEFAPMDLTAYRGQSLTLFTKRGALLGSAELWAARADGSTFQMAQTVGASEAAGAGAAVRVFPNPAASELNVEVLGLEAGSEIWYRAVDVRGRTVLMGSKMLTGRDGHFQVEVSSLSTGLYFLEINTPSGSTAVRFGKM